MTRPATTPATTIELIRHAEAYPRGEWTERPDAERPLTPRGQRQAAAIAEQLSGARVRAVYSSVMARCRQTVAPLADRLGVRIHCPDALAEARTVPVLDGGDAWVTSAWLGGRALGLLRRIVQDHPRECVAACTHGDVLSATLAALAGQDGLDLDDVSCPKGGRFTLTFDGSRCVAAVPVPAPPI